MDKTEKARIEKEAMQYVDQFNNIAPKSAYKTGYIAGATAEHDRLKDTRLYSQEVIDSYEEQLSLARNQAIQDCIDIVSVTPGDENVIPKLESLKTIS